MSTPTTTTSSSQASSFPSVPFSVTLPHQSFRLLELPPDLLELISASGGQQSSAVRLKLKSASAAPTNGSTSAGAVSKSGEGFLHLCTNEKVWAVRQVSTSNSVYVAAPAVLPVPLSTRSLDWRLQDDGDAAATTETLQKPGMTAIARVGNVLELIETKVDLKTVEWIVMDSVPIYEDPDGRDISMSGVEQSVTFDQLFDDTAAADNTIHEALRNLLVFELPAASNIENDQGSSCHIPSDKLLLTAWKLLVQTANIAGIDLAGSLSYGPLLETINEDESDGALYSAVLAAILRKYLPDDPSHRERPREPERAIMGQLQAENTCQFIGQLLIRTTGKNGITLEKLMSNWTGLVPDSWSTTHCSLPLLGAEYKVQTNAAGLEVVYYTKDNESINHASNPADSKGKTPTAATAGKRKWHEKFAAQRDAKR